MLVNLGSWCQRWKEWLQEGGNFQSNLVDPGIAHTANFFPISCCRTKQSTKPRTNKRPETTSALQRHKCFIFSFTFPGTVYYPMKQVFVCLFSGDFSGFFSVALENDFYLFFFTFYSTRSITYYNVSQIKTVNGTYLKYVRISLNSTICYTKFYNYVQPYVIAMKPKSEVCI